MTAWAVSAAAHLVLILVLLSIVLPGRGHRPASFVVRAPEKLEEPKELERKERTRSARKMLRPVPSLAINHVTSSAVSPVFLNPVDVTLGDENLPLSGFAEGVGASWETLSLQDFGPQQSKIGKMFIRARRLGVILDDSPSMSPFLSDLRREIRRGFKGSVIREVTGCFLDVTNPTKPPPQLFYYDPAAVMREFQDLIEKQKVDAIYWFCDLQDGETEDALLQLKSLLGTRRVGKRPVKLFVRSLDQKPGDELLEIIKMSGGDVEVGPPE